jgi:streptomycin 6-kinase
MLIPADVLSLLDLRPLRHVTTTKIADIWQVQMIDGKIAALKVYKDRDPRDEAVGFALLQAKNGHGAAKVFHFAQGVGLMEWLGGATLGDLSRSGQDAEANGLLVETAQAFHRANVSVPGLQSLQDRFAVLMNVGYAPHCPPATRNAYDRAKQVTAHLLATERDLIPLHGDFHHDNVLKGVDGYKAIDAKGLLGERTYELANAFPNPLGAADIIRRPARITHLAGLWAQACDVPSARVLQWAAAHAAISHVWNCDGALGEVADTDFISLLLDMAGA